MQIVSRLTKWLLRSSERRRSPRHAEPGLLAYYWDGSVPLPREIRDISSTGVYVCTTERWYPGTIVELTLNRKQALAHRKGLAESLVVHCKVVRHGSDGVGLRFISLEVQERKALTRFIAEVVATVNRKKGALKQLDGNVRARISHGL